MQSRQDIHLREAILLKTIAIPYKNHKLLNY